MVEPRPDPAKPPSLTPPEPTEPRIQIVSRRLESATHELGKLLHGFWLAHSQDGRLLHKRNVPARELARAIPYLMLIEPANAEGTDWRYRVVGSGITERLGSADRKGLTLSELHPPSVATVRSLNYKRVVDTLVPNISKGRILGTGRDFLEIEVVHLPVIGDHGARWILGGMFFFG